MSEDLIEVDRVMNCPGCPAGETALALARLKIETMPVGAVRLNLLPVMWTPPWEQPS